MKEALLTVAALSMIGLGVWFIAEQGQCVDSGPCYDGEWFWSCRFCDGGQ